MVGPKRPDASVCWCLSYRLLSSKENRELVGPARGERVLELVHQDPPPGVLAYDGDEVVGWAAVHPRADTSFAKNRKIPHVDDLDVWSVWCIRVRPGHRGRGHLPPPAGRCGRVRPHQRRARHRGLSPRQRGGEDRPDDGLRRHEAPLRTSRVHESRRHHLGPERLPPRPHAPRPPLNGASGLLTWHHRTMDELELTGVDGAVLGTARVDPTEEPLPRAVVHAAADAPIADLADAARRALPGHRLIVDDAGAGRRPGRTGTDPGAGGVDHGPLAARPLPRRPATARRAPAAAGHARRVRRGHAAGLPAGPPGPRARGRHARGGGGDDPGLPVGRDRRAGDRRGLGRGPAGRCARRRERRLRDARPTTSSTAAPGSPTSSWTRPPRARASARPSSVMPSSASPPPVGPPSASRSPSTTPPVASTRALGFVVLGTRWNLVDER